MLIQEMIQLNRWLNLIEEKHKIHHKLQQLQTILTANVQAQTQPNNRNPVKSFTEEKKQAIHAMGNINLGELSDSQISCLKVHGAENYLGKIAADELLEIFRDASQDQVFLLEEVKKAFQSIHSARESIKNLTNLLKPYNDAVSPIDYLEKEAIFSIIFKEGVNVDSLNELQDRAKEWNIIMHGIGIAIDVPPSEFRILGARNGSFIIDLYLTAAAMAPIGYILYRSFNILERFALSVKRMHGIITTDFDDPRFKEIENEIKAVGEKYFEKTKKIASKDISKKVLDDLNCDPEKRKEVEPALQKSINKVLQHLKQGGELDAFIPSITDSGNSENEDSESIESPITDTVQLFREVRKMKIDHPKKLMERLEHFNFDEEDDDPDE